MTMTTDSRSESATGDQKIPTTPLEILVEARKLIEKPENWTTGTYARSPRNDYANPRDPYATCFCMVGAVCRAAGMSVREVEDGDLARLLKAVIGCDYPYINQFNDTHTHAEVLAAFDAAIASLRSPVANSPSNGG